MGYFNVIKTCKRSTRSNQLQMKAGILCSATEMIIYSNSVFFDIVAVLKLLSEKNRDCLMSSYFCLLSLHSVRQNICLTGTSKVIKNYEKLYQPFDLKFSNNWKLNAFVSVRSRFKWFVQVYYHIPGIVTKAGSSRVNSLSRLLAKAANRLSCLWSRSNRDSRNLYPEWLPTKVTFQGIDDGMDVKK